MFVLTNPRLDRSLTSAKHIPEPLKERFRRKIVSLFSTTYNIPFCKSFCLISIQHTPGGGGGSMNISGQRALGLVPRPACPVYPACPESRRDLRGLSPLQLTLTKNAPLSLLELTLTKSRDSKSHRITLLQRGHVSRPFRRWRGGSYRRSSWLASAKPNPREPERCL
jgi:hypothetical protein